ncbi:transposase : Uncharacterized protein (Fragment) OS=Legionella pneumophila str. Leg01/53 GN=N750_17330 PE=4 SV=1: Transposase_mut [Gemmata massiliana]|uniref:Mutator family transposase n=1 Tax=Gemmata massiliana TaxID=1210884 RepID=A0A6P2DK70_9BACT
MDAILKSQAEHLAREMGTRVTTLDDLNGLMRAMMTTARERMLNTEMDVHLHGRGLRNQVTRPHRAARRPAHPRPRPRTVTTDIPRRPWAAIWARSPSRPRATATARSSPRRSPRELVAERDRGRKVQRCIVHLVRAARKYTTETDGRDVAADLKTIAPSATVLEAEEALKAFGAKWDGKYPTLGRQWREVERHRHAVRVPAGDPQSDLHDQRAPTA